MSFAKFLEAPMLHTKHLQATAFVETKFDFQNTFSNLTFDLNIKLKVTLNIKIKIKNKKPT